MHCLVLFLCHLWYYFQDTATVPLYFLPPPLLVTCSNPQQRACQRQDNEFHVSCYWEGNIDLKYSRPPVLASQIKSEEMGVQPPPHCQWYQDTTLVHHTNRWTGHLVVSTSNAGGGSSASWAITRITMHCVSAACQVPTCAHYNLTVELSGQDVHFFLLLPRTLPIREWQPVQLGWCARLKSSTWSYRFKSQGGNPAELLIPSNHHSEPPTSTVYPHAELYQVCASYYSYHITVHYHYHGFYSASLHIENGPQLSRSLDLHVQPALLHVFSGSSGLLSLPHKTLRLSWSLQTLSSRIMAFRLVDMQGLEEWSHSYSYNRFALQSDFCAAPKPQYSREKVLASVYFCTNERMSGELTGQLDFSNSTLVFTGSGTTPVDLTLQPQKIQVGTYLFSHALGLFYSTQEGSAANATGESSSFHSIFYQQQSLSHLITVEFLQLQWYRFSVHVYLNRRGDVFRSLGAKEIEVHSFSGHSPDESLAYIVWFIPVQHPLLQCEWAFRLQLFDSRNKGLLWNKTYTYKDHVKNAARFLPGSVLPFKPELYTGFVAEVKCWKTGLAHAVLKTMVNMYASKVIEPTVACQKSYCHELTVIIHKPNLSNPVIVYKRKSQITLQATATAVCRTHSQIGVLWNIYRCKSIQSPPDWSNPLKIPVEIRRDGVTYHMPARYLHPGTYLVNMTMTVHLPAFDIKIRASDSVFLEIIESKLVAKIAGGYFRTVGILDHWTLDGSASFDPDSANPFEGIEFNWYCSRREMDYIEMHLSPQDKCHPKQFNVRWSLSHDPIQIVEPNTLQENMKYYIILLIRKKDKTAYTYQTVHVLPDSVPMLNVTCFENCEKGVKATERFILFGQCLNCEKNHPTVYLWTFLSRANSNETYFDWNSKTTTGRSGPSMHINSLAFGYKPDKLYTLSLKVSTQGKQPSFYQYLFYVNTPSQRGKCSIYPGAGTALFTKFIVHCSGFEDKTGPLTYKVIAGSDLLIVANISSLRKNTFGPIVYIGHQPTTPPSFLPTGIPSEQYVLDIYVQVHDANGVFSEVILQATVHSPSRSKSTGIILSELRDLISRPNAPMSVFNQTKDYLNIGYFAYMVASVLNGLEISQAIHAFKTTLREVLFKWVAEIPLTEIQQLNQIVSSIFQITQELNEFDSELQLIVVKKLKEASEALKMHRNKDLGSRETEVLVSGIFTGLSNVLRSSLLNLAHVNIDAVIETISVMEILADLVLQGKIPGERETSMKAKNCTIHLWKYEMREVSGIFSRRRLCENCFYPRLKQEDHTNVQKDAVVSTIFYVFEENPFPWLADTTDIRTAVTGFKLSATRASGNIIGIIPEAAEVIMARKDKDSATFVLTIGPDKKLYNTTGGFSFEVKRNSKDIFIQILCDMEITFNVFIYLGLNVSHPPIASYIAFYDKPPVLNEVDSNISDCALKAPYILCLPQSLLWFLHQGRREGKWNISVVLHSQPIVRRQTTKIVRIALFTADCLDLDRDQNQWKEGMCSLGPESSWSKIHCICKSKRHSAIRATRQSTGTSGADATFLSGKVTLYPNPLDMNKVLLAEFDSNPVTLLSVGFILAIYIFCVIWAMGRDRADLKRKNKILVLPDNDPLHKVCYVITVYTGSRLGSGTTADVFVELIGNKGVSDVHHLKHPEFPTLFHAAIDTFLLTTKNDLGDIFSLHVWHTSGGSSPNWYLSRVKVLNVHTKQTWLFMCRSWFSLGKADCKIERSFVTSNENSPLNKMDYFLIKLAKDLEDTHIWLSIFARVVTGSFNRVQRASCCLATLLSTLLFNIMFFSDEEGQQVVSVQLRYLKSIYIGFVSALVCIPVQVITTLLFTYSQEKPLPHNTGESGPKPSSFYAPETLGKEPDAGDPQTSEEKAQRPPSVAAHQDTDSEAESEQSNPEFFFFFKIPQFPWRWRYLAWIIIIFMSGISSLFIVLYGLTYGYATSLEWLVASAISFVQSVFLLQTLKMVLISAVSTITRKYCKNIPWINTKQYQNMKLVKVTTDGKEMREVHHELVKRRLSKTYQPLTEDEVVVLRKRVRIQHLAFVFVKDILCHLVFSACILTITYETETTTSFYYNQAIYNKFSPGLSKVNKLEHIYMWMRNVFVPLIHNDFQPTYLSNTWSKILGSPRMRQLRAKNTTKACFHPLSFVNKIVISQSHCHHNYGSDPEDQSNYLGSWTIPTNGTGSSHSSSFQGFTYESDLDRLEYKSYGVLNTYGLGGYSFYFFPGEQQPNTTMRLDDLQRNNWLDERTWVVIFELTTFNPDVDLYCSISVMFEISDVGGVNASMSVHSYRLFVFHYQSVSQYILYFIIVYILVFYLADEFHMLRQERIGYLKTATNLINFAIKTICLYFVLLLALKFQMAFTLLELYLLNSDEFVPFHAVSQIDQLFRVVSGILAFLLVLKPYRYIRFMYNVRLAEKSISAAFPGFVHMSMLVVLLFCIYMSFGYLIFGQYEWGYNSLLHSFQTVVSYCLAPLKQSGLMSNRWLEIFFRASYFVLMMFIFINLWRALIISVYTSMKQPVYEQHSDEAEAINFVVLKIRRIWLLLTRQPPSASETDLVNTVIFGRPVRGNDQQLGLKTQQVNGKQLVYLSV